MGEVVKVRTCVEPFCGTAALSLALIEGKTPTILTPYMGNKKNRAIPILREVGVDIEAGCQLLVLNDNGPWGTAWAVIEDAGARSRLISRLEEVADQNPRAVWETFKQERVPLDLVEYTCRFLCLQRWAYAGKPVSTAHGHWRVPGYCKAAAEGVPRTDKFGEVKPQLPTLIRKLKGLPKLPPLLAFKRDARDLGWLYDTLGPHDLVYIDPNYKDSTGYASGVDRSDVLSLARRYSESGALVIVSETEPLPLEGWSTRNLTGSFQGQVPKNFAKKREEWITYKRSG
jgi:site-specific DNA-adenine methylase